MSESTIWYCVRAHNHTHAPVKVLRETAKFIVTEAPEGYEVRVAKESKAYREFYGRTKEECNAKIHEWLLEDVDRCTIAVDMATDRLQSAKKALAEYEKEKK
jgi:hypothetical protein